MTNAEVMRNKMDYAKSLQPQAQHSPLPWEAQPDGNDGGYEPWVILHSENAVAKCYTNGSATLAKANAKLIVASVNHAEALAEALRDVELRTTQARIASGIGKRKNQTEFLLGELERIAGAAREALANWEGVK